jgi:hypothetical protein
MPVNKKEYNFGEKKEEVINGQKLPVEWITPKYKEAKRKVIELLESEKYKNVLEESDFWILYNTYANKTKVMYSGLIISHDGCLKINDSLDEPLKFKPECMSLDKEGYNNSLVYTYKCPEQGIYEVGEVSPSNLKNGGYPYAMALKRCMDRVILKNSKIAYAGIYSDSEADEFTKRVDEDTPKEKNEVSVGKETLDEKTKLIQEVDNLEIQTSTNHEEMLKFYKVESNIDMNVEQLQDAKHRLEMKLRKQKIENLEIGE